MDPQKALSLRVDPKEIRVETFGGKYRGDWIVYVPDEVRGKRILYQNADVFTVCHWAAILRRLDARGT